MSCAQNQRRDLRFEEIRPRTETWWDRPKGRLTPVISMKDNVEELWQKWHPSPSQAKRMTKRELEASIDRLHNSKFLYFDHISVTIPKTATEASLMTTRKAVTAPCTPRSINQDMVDRMVYRLYQVKPLLKPDQIQSCRLKFRFEKHADAGLGKYVEHWVPSPRKTDQERTKALIKLAEKCKLEKEAMQLKLKKKYLQPLTCNKKLTWKELAPKLIRMHEGKRWTRCNLEI